jgi:methionine-rich copper-binding protein CopC
VVASILRHLSWQNPATKAALNRTPAEFWMHYSHDPNENRTLAQCDKRKVKLVGGEL